MQSTAAHTTRFSKKGVLCAVLLLGSLAHLVWEQLNITYSRIPDICIICRLTLSTWTRQPTNILPVSPGIQSRWPIASWKIQPSSECAAVSQVPLAVSAGICKQKVRLAERLLPSLSTESRICCDPTISSNFFARPARSFFQDTFVLVRRPKMPRFLQLLVFLVVCRPNHAHSGLLAHHVAAIEPTTSVRSWMGAEVSACSQAGPPAASTLERLWGSGNIAGASPLTPQNSRSWGTFQKVATTCYHYYHSFLKVEKKSPKSSANLLYPKNGLLLILPKKKSGAKQVTGPLWVH